MTQDDGYLKDRTCPECRAPLIERENHASKRSFIGCSQWPECHYTAEIPLHVLLRRAGAQPLPGFD